MQMLVAHLLSSEAEESEVLKKYNCALTAATMLRTSVLEKMPWVGTQLTSIVTRTQQRYIVDCQLDCLDTRQQVAPVLANIQ